MAMTYHVVRMFVLYTCFELRLQHHNVVGAFIVKACRSSPA